MATDQFMPPELMPLATEETATGLSLLLSGSTLLMALAAFYVGRSLWIARREWPQCRTDTKVLYLLVAPVLTFAVDVLAFTDRLFWSGKTVRPRTKPTLVQFRPKSAMRSEG
jgi:hypothetical protein